jgi:hypothetical protein
LDNFPALIATLSGNRNQIFGSEKEEEKKSKKGNNGLMQDCQMTKTQTLSIKTVPIWEGKVGVKSCPKPDLISGNPVLLFAVSASRDMRSRRRLIARRCFLLLLVSHRTLYVTT